MTPRGGSQDLNYSPCPTLLNLLMTDTGNNRMVKKKTNKQKTLNIKDLRSACLEIFFSLFRPWCEDENLCVF